MYVHEERLVLDYPYQLNSLTNSYGYYPQEWKESIHRTQSWDSAKVSSGEAELTSLPVHVSLHGRDLWDKFNNIATEMLITKTGRRMFPSCKVTVTGLNPRVKYVVMMDMVPFDNNKYKWSWDHWEANGACEPRLPDRFFIHPDSPALGERWMQYPISFHKLKLTNNALNSNGLHIVLHSMHKYQPRLHIVQAPDPCGAHRGAYLRFTFPEAAFIAVTAYQNHEITKLKIDNNPFAKGFRDNGLNRKRFRNKEIHGNQQPGPQHNKTQSHEATGLADTDEEADETVSSSGDSASTSRPPDVKEPSSAVSNPFICAFMNRCGVGLETWSQSPERIHAQHTANPSAKAFERPQYICASLPVTHGTQTQFTSGEQSYMRPPAQGGGNPAARHHASVQTEQPLPRPDLERSLPLPPKLRRMQLPESALGSLEVIPHTGPRPLADILNRIRARAVASGSLGESLQVQVQHELTGLGSDRDTRALCFPAVQDCGAGLCTEQRFSPLEWTGFTGDSGERQYC